MAAERGSAFLLKLGGGSPVSYATVAGLKTTQLTINGDAVAITNKDSGGWRELLSGAGVRWVSVAASGIFTGSAAEGQVKSLALSGQLASQPAGRPRATSRGHLRVQSAKARGFDCIINR